MKSDLSLTSNERWHVVQTLSNRETGAASQLVNQGFRTFMPRYLKTRRHARKIDTVLAPLFPRYLFIIIDTSRDRWRSVNGTFGVVSLIMEGERPMPVPAGVVESLVAQSDGSGRIALDAWMGLEEGHPIRVMAGPFANQIGLLDRLNDNGRVKVLLDIMGGTVPVELSRTVIMPTQNPWAAI